MYVNLAKFCQVAISNLKKYVLEFIYNFFLRQNVSMLFLNG